MAKTDKKTSKKDVKSTEVKHAAPVDKKAGKKDKSTKQDAANGVAAKTKPVSFDALGSLNSISDRQRRKNP